jgi:hypothetical protein
MSSVFFVYKINFRSFDSATAPAVRPLIKYYKAGNKKAFQINLIILIFLTTIVLWKLRIIPLALNNDFKNKTAQLTGKKFWSWNNYRYEELGIRGEGYTLEIYNLNSEMTEYFKNPNPEFFQKYPTNDISDMKWKTTPVDTSDKNTLEHMTPNYSGWKNEIINKQEYIRRIANEPEGYYCYKANDFYLISYKEKIILWINHNM